jgi:hypothetical protein
MTFVPVEEISEVFEQAFGKRIITPVFLGEAQTRGKDGVVVPMRRSTKRPVTSRRTAVSTRKR